MTTGAEAVAMIKSSPDTETPGKYPFDSLEQETLLNLLRTTDHLTAEFARLFAAHGLSGPQYNVLRILRAAGDDGLQCLEIAGQMITRMPDITRLVDRLEAAGLVERSRTMADRRAVIVRMTPKGLDLLCLLDTPVRETHERAMANLTADEQRELIRLLTKARASSL
jgi:DNA-binding MarR family transcriptional regulator